MTHRERVLTALRHREPDRVPIDLGGTVDSTVSAMAYQPLRRALGLPANVTRVADVCQFTAIIDRDVREALQVDTAIIQPEPRQWSPGTLPDGSSAEFPARFQPQLLMDGSQVLLDDEGTVTLRMPAGGYYFDPVHSPLWEATTIQEIDKHWQAIEAYDSPAYLDKSYRELAGVARSVREETDYLVVAFFGGHILQAGQQLRGWERFLVDLLTNRPLAEALMDRLTDAHIRRFARFAETVGPFVDVVQFEEDLGMQDRPLMSPALYRQAVKPYHQRLFGYARSACTARLLLHSDGAVAPLIPDFIEMGVDALNPIQISAAGMDPAELKRQYGQDLTFWGAACDSQEVLPYGTPQDVADQVRRQIDILAPGGGFVLAPIHNIQAGVPAANVVALFRTAHEHGRY